MSNRMNDINNFMDAGRPDSDELMAQVFSKQNTKLLPEPITHRMSVLLRVRAAALAVMVAIALPLLFPASAAARQDSDFDKDLMKRDLEIMESVLKRILSPADQGAINISGASASAFYLPGFGVMIEASAGVRVPGISVYSPRHDTLSGRVTIYSPGSARGTDPNAGGNVTIRPGTISGTSGTIAGAAAHEGSNQAEIDARNDEIREMIISFLKNYAGVINQLRPDDRVAVIYTSRGHMFMPAISIGGSLDRDPQQLRSMTIVARFSDLDAYRRGRIDEQTFSGNLIVNKMMTGDAARTDIEIFGQILDTGLKTSDRESISLRGNISRFYVGGVGAMFNLHAGYGQRGGLPDFEVFPAGSFYLDTRVLTEQAQQLSKSAQELLEMQDQGRESSERAAEQLTSRVRALESLYAGISEDSLRNNRQYRVRLQSLLPDPEKFEEEYGVFERNLKAYMVDYGRTLSSLKEGESLIISVNISGANRSGMPGRYIYKIDRDVLAGFDRRSISRDQAIGRIVKMEY